MAINTVIFDMDGLLIDSEPIWQEAANEIFSKQGIHISQEQYDATTGLRTPEFLAYWIQYFKMDDAVIAEWDTQIVNSVIEKVLARDCVMKGVEYIFNFFAERNYKIGLASSSPINLIDAVVEKLHLRPFLAATASAQDLPYGKPHPEVYINCAAMLNSNPNECICFEDSINGMIAAKAAKMKCVVVPSLHLAKDARWSLADLQLSSLQNFGVLHLERLTKLM